MTETRAEAAALATTATRFDDVNAALRDRLRRLMTELDTLHTQWQGAGGRSFAQVQAAWARDQEQLHNALGDTAAALRGAASGYDATDIAASARFRPQAGSPISLPL
jgi:WXG100 family type VII secretion target